MEIKGTIIIKEEEWFVATCTENNIASQGKTIDEATENLKEALVLFYEDEVKDGFSGFPDFSQRSNSPFPK